MPMDGGPTRENKDKFLDLLREHYTYTNAAKAAGCSRRAIEKWRKKDPEFNDECAQVRQHECPDELEAAIYRRALNGTLEPVLHNGKVVEHNGKIIMRRKYETGLTIFMMKAMRPEKFGDRLVHTVDPGQKTGVLVAPSDMDPQDWIREHTRVKRIKATEVPDNGDEESGNGNGSNGHTNGSGD